MLYKYAFLLLVFASIFSCGKKINSKVNATEEYSLLKYGIIDSECVRGDFFNTELEKRLSTLKFEIEKKGIALFGSLGEGPFYSHIDPLVMSNLEFDRIFLKIENQVRLGLVSGNDFSRLSDGINRFSSMKCKLKELEKKRIYDIRPYQYFKDNHIDSALKNESELKKLCQTIKSTYHCQKEIKVFTKENRLKELLNSYMKSYKEDRLNKLFSLRDQYSKFKCVKNNEELILEIKIYNRGFRPYQFSAIIESIKSFWAKKNLSFNFIETSSEVDANLIIHAIKNGVSHVKDDDLKRVYLNDSLDLANLKLVAAHEFGHVLGFPDCYFEFFDSSKYSLIYYEKEEYRDNIMCSVHAGAKVRGDYIDQIVKKSCLNQ